MSQFTIGIVSKCAIPFREVPVRTPDRPTIADVAAAAGVGVGTVSRVLNGGVNVRESTRLKVLGVIERLGYRPSHLAAALSRGTPRTVAILVPHLTRPSTVARLAGALAVLDEQRYDTIVCNADTPEQRDHHLAALAARHRADGVIVVSISLARHRLAAFRRAAIPLVTVDAIAAGVPQTIIDDVAGGRLATGHLLSLGHRRIGFVGNAAAGQRSAMLPSADRSRTRAAPRPAPGWRGTGGSWPGPASTLTLTWSGSGRTARRWRPSSPISCWRCPIRRPRSSPSRTPRRWACSAPRSSVASRYQAGCRWSASMTSSRPRCSSSARCTSRWSRAARRAPGDCAHCCAGPGSGRFASCSRCGSCSGPVRPRWGQPGRGQPSRGQLSPGQLSRRQPGRAPAGRSCPRPELTVARTNGAGPARARRGWHPVPGPAAAIPAGRCMPRVSRNGPAARETACRVAC